MATPMLPNPTKPSFIAASYLDLGLDGFRIKFVRHRNLRTPPWLALSAVGGSIADFAGRAKLVDIEMAGGSIARLTDLEADEAHLQIAGAAEVDVCVKHRLEGDAAGNSDVRYTCNPREVDVDTSGGSSVSRF